MKVCGDCGSQYSHRVDFCFHDGVVLVVVDAVTELPALPRDFGNRPDDGPMPLRIGGVAAELFAEPPADRSNLLMAGAVLAFMALLVPVVGGGLLTYSMVVTNEWDGPATPHAEP